MSEFLFIFSNTFTTNLKQWQGCTKAPQLESDSVLTMFCVTNKLWCFVEHFEIFIHFSRTLTMNLKQWTYLKQQWQGCTKAPQLVSDSVLTMFCVANQLWCFVVHIQIFISFLKKIHYEPRAMNLKQWQGCTKAPQLVSDSVLTMFCVASQLWCFVEHIEIFTHFLMNIHYEPKAMNLKQWQVCTKAPQLVSDSVLTMFCVPSQLWCFLEHIEIFIHFLKNIHYEPKAMERLYQRTTAW